MPSHTISIVKDSGNYTIGLNSNGREKLEKPSDKFWVRVTDDTISHPQAPANCGIRLQLKFFDTDNVITLEVSKVGGNHVLQVIGSEDFRDARAANIPPVILQDSNVSISIEDDKEPGVKVLVLETH